MSYLVLARKWRPLTFDEMVGQEHVSRTLKNAVKTGRVAHAFLFAGSRGVGKTSAARILAKCLNCDQGPTPDPCNRCPSCDDIASGRSMDVYEIDGASNTSVDDIRELRENVKYMPMPGKRKIYIIDEVHMLSRNAFNALLKTLEEPPEHVVFIFATTEPHKVPETIQSRCQRYDFKRIPQRKIQERIRQISMEEGLSVSDQALSWIARAADGSMRDAQSLLDQAISYCGRDISDEAVGEMLGIAGRELFMRISDAVLQQDAAGCIRALDDLYQLGFDLTQFYRDLVEHFRNLLIARVMPEPSHVLDVPDSHIEELTRQVAGRSTEDLQRLLSLLTEAEEEILRSSLPKIGLELTLIKMATHATLEPLERILEKIEALEQGFPDSGGPAPGTRQPPKPSAEKPDPSPKKPAARDPSPAKTPRMPSPSGQWEAFVSAVKEERAVLGALLENVLSWELDAQALKVYCPEGSFLLEKIRQPDVKELLTKHVRDHFGKERVFLPCGTSNVTGNRTAPEPDTPSAERSHPLTAREEGAVSTDEEQAKMIPAVRAALEVFGGTITEFRRIEPENNQ